MQNIWDKKSKTYPKFNNTKSAFQIEFFDFLTSSGVNFEGKSVIDVGCGTGVYTLFIAQKAKNVLGIDTSKDMLNALNALKQSAKDEGLNNIQTLQSGIYGVVSKFDIAFLTMSPALKNETDFKKFMSFADLRVYMNWAKPRTSNVLEPFFEKYGRTQTAITITQLEAYLKNRQIPYKSKILNEFRSVKRSLSEAYENVSWHLEINGIKLPKEEILKELQKLAIDEFITEDLSSSMKVLVF